MIAARIAAVAVAWFTCAGLLTFAVARVLAHVDAMEGGSEW